jgi:hypothetical protein
LGTLTLDGVDLLEPLDPNHLGTLRNPTILRAPGPDGTTASLRAHAVGPVERSTKPQRAVDPRLLEELRALGYTE